MAKPPGALNSIDSMQSTLVGMFLSGGSAQAAPQGPAAASQKQRTSLSASTGLQSGQVADFDGEDPDLELEYFPDPPCIAPFADEEEKNDVKTMKGAAPQSYFKGHVQWIADDLQTQQARLSSMAFVELWNKKHGISDGATTERIARLTKRSTFSSFASRSDLGETSFWAFVNITQTPVGIRSVNALDEDKKTGEVIHPGHCVLIERIAEQEGIRYLKLSDGRGWVFDSNGKDTIMAKMEEVEIGVSWHRVVGTKSVDIRRTPVYGDAARTSRLLAPRELVVVNIKARIRGQTWVHLADGRGWVFVMLAGAKKVKSLSDTVMQDCDAEITMGDSYADMFILPPTTEAVEVGLWTYIVGTEALLAIGTKPIGTFIEPGDVIKVDKRAFQDGNSISEAMVHSTSTGAPALRRRWLRLADGRGWLADKNLAGKDVVTLRAESFVSYPSHFKGAKNIDRPSAAWMVGMV